MSGRTQNLKIKNGLGSSLNPVCMDEEKRWKALKYNGEIMDLIEHKDEFTSGDLDGAVMAIVLKIMEGK